MNSATHGDLLKNKQYCGRCRKWVKSSFFEPHNARNCPCLKLPCEHGCGKLIQNNNKQNHRNVCPNYDKSVEKNKLKCANCERNLTKATYQRHVSTLCPKLVVKCPKCPDKLLRMSLNQHLKNVHKQTAKNNKRAHFKDENNSSRCCHCKKMVLNIYFGEHVANCHRMKVTCEVCGKQNLLKGNLKSHHQTQSCLKHRKEPVTQPDAGKSKCKHCNKLVNDKIFRFHEKSRCKQRPINCPHCDMQIKAASRVKHLQSCKKLGAVKMVICKCGSKYRIRSHWVHKAFFCKLNKRKLAGDVLKCEKCGKSVVNRYSLRVHTSFHCRQTKSIFRFNCPHCKKSFFDPSAARKHKLYFCRRSIEAKRAKEVYLRKCNIFYYNYFIFKTPDDELDANQHLVYAGKGICSRYLAHLICSQLYEPLNIRPSKKLKIINELIQTNQLFVIKLNFQSERAALHGESLIIDRYMGKSKLFANEKLERSNRTLYDFLNLDESDKSTMADNILNRIYNEYYDGQAITFDKTEANRLIGYYRISITELKQKNFKDHGELES